MGWAGLVGAGISFFSVGLLHAYANANATLTHPHTTFVTLLEHSLVAFLSLLHIIASFVAAHTDHTLGFDVSSAMVLERSGVAMVFLLYAGVVLVAGRSRLLPLPQEALHLFAICAFGLEFVFFYVGEERESSLEGQYHHLMLVPIGACVFTKVLEIAYSKSALPRLAHSMGLILQGTWFFQMALSLFSPKFIAMGCHLDQKGAADYTIRCEGMSLMRGKAIATLQFNNHMAFLLLFLLPLFSMMMRKKASISLNYEPLGDSEGAAEGRELFHLKGKAPEGAFVLEDEELSGDSIEINGFPNDSMH